MIHALVLTFVAATACGIGATVMLLGFARRVPRPYLHPTIAQLVLFNLIVALNFAAFYAWANVESLSAGPAGLALSIAYHTVSTMLKLAWTTVFVAMIAAMAGRTVPRLRRPILVICSPCLLCTAIALWRLSETDLEWLAAIHGLVEAVTAGITWGATAWLISRTTAIATRERAVIRPFALAVLIIWTTIFAVFFAGHYLAPRATIERMLVSGVLLIFYNVIPTAILARRILAQEAPSPATRSRDSTWQELVRSHGVSPREAEVVQLVCQGRTNRQIADELCISLQTVKDHNYRIYRKLGVRNRVQLVNLVRAAD